MDKMELAGRLLEFLHESQTAFNAVEVMKKELLSEGYQELDGDVKWSLMEGDKAFYTKNGSSLFMVRIGSDPLVKGFRMVGAHTDSPGFRIKPGAEMVNDGFLRLNTETYGGPILSTWFDRPLTLAGRVVLKGDSPLKPRMETVNFRRPMLIIPSVAIHFNRNVNEGVAIDKQKHVLPVMSMAGKDFAKENLIRDLVAEEMNVAPEEILDYDLFLCEAEKGIVMGLSHEFISSKRQDNLNSVHGAMEALKAAEVGSGIRVAAFFDNEECGSRSKQGADSVLLANLLERVYYSLGGDREGFLRSLESSFMISADLAHSVHPNYADMHDPVNRPLLNKGPVIKLSANQKYTTDGDSAAAFSEICRKAEVPFQTFVNRSDLAGGSTIGPAAASHLPVRSVDIGTPLLGMHSVRELGGVDDHLYLVKALKVFFEEN